MITNIEKAAELIAHLGNVVALTGAGISVESGIPPFRGEGGVWERFDPMEYAHIHAFLKDPEKVWREFLVLLKKKLDHAAPNDAHKGLARLERMGLLGTVITKNIDGLHQAAGNTDVIEFHGTFASYRCMSCNSQCSNSEIELSHIPPRCRCGGIFRPECIFFGELIPPHLLWRSEQAASDCDVMLVIGTSAVVQPAAMLPVIAKESGATVIEINAERTPLTDTISHIFLEGSAVEIIPRILEKMDML